MLSIAHATTGAFMAHLLPNPALYVPLTLASHYFQDWIPHWDCGTGLSSGKRTKRTAIMLELVDLALSVTVIYFLFQQGEATMQYHVWLGALIGILPDLLEAPRNFLRWEPRFLQPINRFHARFHESIPSIPLGLFPQVVTLTAIWMLTSIG
ncbi:MAG: hypothetical protein H6774_02935 [Pseudomonadales bacterium]|nr:hypothetical protein [Candidatus Woesebacteria bacterium]MCB9802020.1 hypothetical protein [Pseudomonadales bacterium]